MKKALTMYELVKKQLENNVYLRVNYIKTMWSDIVGKNLSKKTYPIFLKDKVLHIGVESSAWLQQLQLLKNNIIKNINDYLEGVYVEKLVLKVVKDKNKEIEKEEIEIINQIDIDNIVLSKDDIYNIKKSISKIENYEIKKKIFYIMMKNRKREIYLIEKGYKKCKQCNTLFLGKKDICYSCEIENNNKFEKEIYYYIYNNPTVDFNNLKLIYSKISYGDYEKIKKKFKNRVYEKINYYKQTKNIDNLKKELEIYIKLETGIKDQNIINEKIEKLLQKQ